MNLPLYLARKLKTTDPKSFSAVIVKIGIISVALAVCVLILSFFVLIGFKNTIQSKLFALSSHIQVSKFTSNTSFEEHSLVNNLDLEAQTLKNPKIKYINKIATKSCILKATENLEGLVFKAYDSLANISDLKESIVKGFFPKNDSEIMISSITARLLGIKLNDKVLVYFIQNPPKARKLKITGIYDTGIEEYDKIYLFGKLGLVQKINDWPKGYFGHYEIFIKDFSDLEITKKQLLKTFPQEYDVKTIKENLPQFYDWFNLLDRNIILIIVLLILVAGFNMAAVLLIMIMERTPMIGLLKALGTKNTSIYQIFMYNTSKICLWGLFYGNLVALSLAFLQDKFKLVKLDPVSYYMSSVPISWHWSSWVFVNIGVFVVILLVSLLPIYRTKKVNIIAALKYKD